MTDMRAVIEPKSDQLNTDDLISGPRTIRIRDVKIAPSGEQRVSVFFDGDNGKPWRPCKGMCRIMVEAWGADAKEYIGRWCTLYREPKVTWAGLQIGGIRISHMSHIERDMVTAVTESQKRRSPLIVKVLTVPAPAAKVDDKAAKLTAMVDKLLVDIGACASVEELGAYLGTEEARKQTKWLQDKAKEHSAIIEKAIADKSASLKGEL
jgi:hypothetical protein